MRIYVELTHTVPIEVDADHYDVDGMDREALAKACGCDEDFAEMIGNGPHPIHDTRWEVVTDVDYMERLDAEHSFFDITATMRRATS